MITNILLGLILGIILSSYIIINKKVTQIQSNTEYILTKLRGIDGVNSNNNKLINQLLDRFNDKVLKDSEHWRINEDYYNNIITLLKSRFKDVDNATDSIYDKLNSMDNDTTILIIGKSNEIRNEIKKQAKISSKINSKTKTSKSINK